MTRLIVISVFLIIGLNCSTVKAQYTYEICVQQDSETSEVIKNEIIGVADTTVAFLSGQVIDKETKEPLLYANVSLTDRNSKKVYGIATNKNGEYEIIAPAGNYLFVINYVGYSDLTEKIIIGTGELRKIEVQLGQGGAFVTYEIKSDKKLNKRQLNKKAEELKK